MEHFQWLDPAAARARCEDADFRAAVAEEAADVCCYLLSFINAMNLDLSNAVRDKMQKNAKKYPADRFLGRFELGRESPPTE